MTTYVYDGFTLTVTEDTYNECAKAGTLPGWVDPAIALRERLWNAMLEAEKSGDWDLYSDLHKDLFGVRPRL